MSIIIFSGELREPNLCGNGRFNQANLIEWSMDSSRNTCRGGLPWTKLNRSTVLRYGINQSINIETERNKIISFPFQTNISMGYDFLFNFCIHSFLALCNIITVLTWYIPNGHDKWIRLQPKQLRRNTRLSSGSCCQCESMFLQCCCCSFQQLPHTRSRNPVANYYVYIFTKRINCYIAIDKW